MSSVGFLSWHCSSLPYSDTVIWYEFDCEELPMNSITSVEHFLFLDDLSIVLSMSLVRK